MEEQELEKKFNECLLAILENGEIKNIKLTVFKEDLMGVAVNIDKYEMYFLRYEGNGETSVLIGKDVDLLKIKEIE